MNKNLLKLFALFLVLSILIGACTPAAPAAQPTKAPDANSNTATEPTKPAVAAAPTKSELKPGQVEIRWFIGLGTGGDPEQQEGQKAVVEEFNRTHPNIKLTMEVVTYNAAPDTLATEIASGNPPDIVGPVGGSGANSFYGAWLDLAPLVEKNKYDLSQYDKDSVEFFKTGGEGQVGLPFAIYPSIMYYQPDMFKEAGLNPPPHKYGEKYKWADGTEEEWTFETMTKLAKKLTVDKNGKDATQSDFDPKNIVQYGYVPQYQDLRAIGSYWGADSLVEQDKKTVRIPEQWKASWKWFYDGMWKDHFIPTEPVIQSEAFGATNPFNSGKVAMAITHLWYTCCVENAGKTWDIAALPAYKGKVTSNFNADTFRILKASKHQDEAFTVLSYFVGDASLKLLDVYGGMPARKADQQTFFDNLNKKFEQKPDWQVVIDSIKYMDIPNFESYIPNYQEAFTRYEALNTLLKTTEGLDFEKEVEKLKTDLQVIFDKKTK
jgi:multiple sugar transport system substrate-binding protein